MPLAPAITDLEQLKTAPGLAELLAWKPELVESAKFDRDELTLTIKRDAIRDACLLLRDHAGFDFLADITCVDWMPRQPRFEVAYHLLSRARKQRVRLKVKAQEDQEVPALTPVWPAADFFEREVFDLFGVRFEGHPYLRRILMPDDWEGHPLRKDYPVEGYR